LGAPPAALVDWPAFMARHDLVWSQLPGAWHEGAFLGNGLLGAMIYGDRDQALRFDLGRSDVVEHPPTGNYRLPIGTLVLHPVGRVTGGTMRLDLLRAEVTGTLETERGSIGWRAFVHTAQMVLVIELTPTAGEAGCRFDYLPEPAVNPRSVYRKEEVKRPNPEGRQETVDGIHIYRQDRASGGGYALGGREIQRPDGTRVVYTTIADSFPDTGAAQQALESIRLAESTGVPALLESHRAWWAAFYRQSFLSLPDTRLESFYWIQMYKLGSATRPDRPAIDLMGPWFRTTPWAMIWWNLNLQLTYWPVYTANHLELGESLTRMLDNGLENLIANVKPEWRADSAGIGRTSSYDCRGGQGNEFGNLLWTCHNAWLQYRYSMDQTMLRERLLPLLKRSVNLYLHLIEPDPQGRLHLPLAVSPEYPEPARSTNYDLSLLRWGLTTLLAEHERLHLADPQATVWRETLDKLIEYPTGPDGLMIGEDVPLAVSHRHFSHLLMIYPLHLLSGAVPAERALIERSLEHWIGFEGALQGYSFTGAACIAASLGERERPVAWLNTFLDRFVKPNTMYLEAGPVIETPLSAARAIQELVLQSWGDRLRIFPAVPAAWPDVSFDKLLAEGAFEVSAARQGGRTQCVAVLAKAGGVCRIEADLARPVAVDGVAAERVREADGLLTIALQPGEQVTLRGAGVGQALVTPVAAQVDRVNVYGSPKAIPVRAAADGSFTLPASRAVLHGTRLFYEKGNGRDNIGHWIAADEWVSWELADLPPGRYATEIRYASPSDGRSCAVLCAGQQLDHAVQKTGDWSTFQTFALGTLTVTAGGRLPLEVRATKLSGGGLMNLQSVTLRPE